MSRIYDENMTPISIPQKCRPMSPFIAKLRLLLKQRKYSNAIHWSADGRSLVISDIETFKDQVLETEDEMFKTKNFASFVRQLNLYGFRKIQMSNLKGDPTLDMHFEHPNFRRDRPDLVSLVHRTCNSTKRRSLVSHFQDVYTPKKLRLDGGASLPTVSPLVDRQNIPDRVNKYTPVKKLFDGPKENNDADVSKLVVKTDLVNGGYKVLQSTEHDYALPMYNRYDCEEIVERKTYNFLNKHFQDEIIVVQALLSMSSRPSDVK